MEYSLIQNFQNSKKLYSVKHIFRNYTRSFRSVYNMSELDHVNAFSTGSSRKWPYPCFYYHNDGIVLKLYKPSNVLTQYLFTSEKKFLTKRMHAKAFRFCNTVEKRFRD